MKLPSIIHVDMDAFYASVEQLDNPEYRGKPVIVGGGKRGVVSAASYEARRFGVKSAMAMYKAKALCPEAVVTGVRMSRYKEVSKKMHEIFAEYTPLIEPISIDEAFLDVTASEHLFGGAEKIGAEIKGRIRTELELIASVGISFNKFLAKLASEISKPDGFLIINAQNKQQILDPLPVSQIWGVGGVTAEKLERFGINTIQKLRETPLVQLKNLVGKQAEVLLQLSEGIDCRKVLTAQPAKSISTEDTFSEDISDSQELISILYQQVELVALRLRQSGLSARTITIKFRYPNFKTITRSATLSSPTDRTKAFLQKAEELFTKWRANYTGSIRLMGFGLTGLTKAKTSAGLFDMVDDSKQKSLDSTLDKIRIKYGIQIMKRGK